MKTWALKALSDSDFASDKETRISGFGYIIYFCGIPIAWRSKGMKSVVLSTTGAEYMALSEVMKELKFIVQLLQTMNIEVELPITVFVDNVGAIWLSNNRTTSDRTKHIDIRTSFVKEYQEDRKIIIKFVNSEDNEADIFAKNTTNVMASYTNGNDISHLDGWKRLMNLSKRNKHDLTCIASPKRGMKSTCSWTNPFKSSTSSTLCLGEPTLGKLNQKTEFCITIHITFGDSVVHTGTTFSVPSSSSETSKVSD